MESTPNSQKATWQGCRANLNTEPSEDKQKNCHVPVILAELFINILPASLLLELIFLDFYSDLK